MYGENPFLMIKDKPFFLSCQVLIFSFNDPFAKRNKRRKNNQISITAYPDWLSYCL